LQIIAHNTDTNLEAIFIVVCDSSMNEL